MAVRSIIDIEVNDADFQRYAAAFEKYKEGLKDQPDAWNEVSAASAAAAAAAAEMGVSVAAAFIALHKANEESSEITHNAQRQATAWSSMASNAGKFTSRVIEATRSLLRWGELTGLISGILGAGGLFGIDRLATSAGEQRKHALTLGATPGEVAGAQIDLARITDPNAFMSNINKGITDVTSPQYLAMMNVGAHPEGRTDAAQAAFDTMLALKKRVDQIPENGLFGPTAHANKLDELMPMDELLRLRRMSSEDVATYVAQGRSDTKNLELTSATTKAWQDLQTQLHRAGAELENSLIRGLVSLAGPIGRLSAAFVKLVEDVVESKQLKEWVDELAVGIKWLGDYIGSGKFHENVMWLLQSVDDVGHKFMELVKRVDDALPSVDSLKGYAEEAGQAFKLAEDAAKSLWGAVDTVARSMAGAAHAILDPWTNGRKPTQEEADKWNKEHPDNQIPADQIDKDTGPGSATGWDRLKSWWNGGSFGGHMDHPAAYRSGEGGSFGDIERTNNLPVGFLESVEHNESGGRDVASPAGAQGYFQFMPKTAARFSVDPHDEASSARGAGAYFHELIDEFKGDVAKAVAGYNWGEANVEKDVAQYGERWREHLPEETKAYVERVLRRTEQNEMASNTGPKFVPNQGRPSSVAINVNNQTGGNSYISASQLAVG